MQERFRALVLSTMLLLGQQTNGTGTCCLASSMQERIFPATKTREEETDGIFTYMELRALRFAKMSGIAPII